MPPHPVPELESDLVSSRVIGAPRETVFQAFLDPEVLARWWGPAGFTNTFHEFDPRPGGLWRFVMRGPDGSEYSLAKEFVEVAAPERIVLRQVDAVHGFVMSMHFDREGSGTRLTWRMRFDSAEEADKVRTFVLAANEQNFDRLEAELGGQAPDLRRPNPPV